MSPRLLLKIITPEAVIHEEMVEQVTMPTLEGEITILPEHVPLITIIGKGDIVAVENGEHIPFLVIGGFVRITGTDVTIMADMAAPMSSIANEETIEAAQARAAELQRQFENEELVDFEHFESELQRTLLSIKIGDKWKIRKYRK